MKRVLLIEPDAILAKTYRMAFLHAGYEVQAVNSAEMAISTVDEFLPHVIVLELQLRLHNGVEFLHELRSYADLQSIPVVILSRVSAEVAGFTKEIQRQLGVWTFCHKPKTDLGQLIDIVKLAIS